MLSIAPNAQTHCVNVNLARLNPEHLINQRVAEMCVASSSTLLLLLLFENKRSEIHWRK